MQGLTPEIRPHQWAALMLHWLAYAVCNQAMDLAEHPMPEKDRLGFITCIFCAADSARGLSIHAHHVRCARSPATLHD